MDRAEPPGDKEVDPDHRAVPVALAGHVLPMLVALATVVPLFGLVPGTYRFTRHEEPLPAVVTMVLTAVGMTVGWVLVADLPSAVPL